MWLPLSFLINRLAYPAPSSPVCSDYSHLPWQKLQPQDKTRQWCNWQARVQLTALVSPAWARSTSEGSSRRLLSILIGLFPGAPAPHFHLAGSPGILSGFCSDPPLLGTFLASVCLHFALSFLEMLTSSYKSARSWKDVFPRPPRHPGCGAHRPVVHTVSALKAALWVLPFQLCPL